MLQTIIKYGKNLLTVILFAAMILTSLPKDTAYADYSENTIRPTEVVIRAGEWGNKDTVKPGKRYTWGNDINLSQHGISIKEIPSDIPLRVENNEWFISEYDINLKLAKAIAKKLDSKYGVDVNLQYATDKSGDLNAAGRRAMKCDPKIYLSVHHNSFKDDSTGYFFMYNEGDTKSAEVANKFSNSIKNNNYVPQRSNRANDGYIGELNQFKNSNKISILGEFGYFNKAEIVKICSDDYVNYVSDKIAESIYNQLQGMNPTKQAVLDKAEEVMNVNEMVESLNETLENISSTVENINEIAKDIENTKVITAKNTEHIKITIDNVQVKLDNTRSIAEPEVITLSFK